MQTKPQNNNNIVEMMGEKLQFQPLTSTDGQNFIKLRQQMRSNFVEHQQHHSARRSLEIILKIDTLWHFAEMHTFSIKEIIIEEGLLV